MEPFVARASALLAATPPRWERLVQAADAELLRRAPAPGEWSALECLQHLLDTEEQAFPVRVRAFLAGRDLVAFDPDAGGSPAGRGGDAAAMAARFTAARAASLDLLRGLGPGDLDRRVNHPELGPVSLGEMLHEWVGHDLMHTVQAERALLQPFIAGSGAWRGYFADHVAGAAPRG